MGRNEGEDLGGVGGRATVGRGAGRRHGGVEDAGQTGRVDGGARFNDENRRTCQLVQRALGHDVAVVDQHDSISRALGLDQFVRRNQEGAPPVPLTSEELANYLTTLGVDGRRRFVKDEDGGPSEERERQLGPLLLAPAQSPPRRRGARVKGQQVNEFLDVARVLVIRRGEAQDLAGSHRKPDTTALQERPGASHDVGVVLDWVEVVQAGDAARWSPEAEERLDEGGLAGPIWSEERHDLTEVDVQTDVGNGRDIAEVNAEVFGGNGVAHGY